VAVSAGPAADKALARPMNPDEEDDQHKNKKHKPFQYISQ